MPHLFVDLNWYTDGFILLLLYKVCINWIIIWIWILQDIFSNGLLVLVFTFFGQFLFQELLPRRFVIWISKKVIVGEENLVKQVKRTVNFIHLPH